MKLEYLKEYCKSVIEEYPQLTEEVLDLFVLAKDEIEAGESESNEVHLAVSSIEDLIKEL